MFHVTSREPFRVVGIDPGTSKTGFSALEYHPDQCINVFDAFSCCVPNTLPYYNDIVDVHGARVARIMYITDTFKDLIENFNPHYVICESPHATHIQTFGALTECITMFRSALMYYDTYIPFDLVDPPSVKKNIGVPLGRGNSEARKDKTLVERLVRARKDVHRLPADYMDEHSFDATAIALYHIDNRFKRGRHAVS